MQKPKFIERGPGSVGEQDDSGGGDFLSLYLGACMSLRCTMRESFQIVPGHGAQQRRSPWQAGVDEEEPEKGKQEREERGGGRKSKGARKGEGKQLAWRWQGS